MIDKKECIGLDGLSYMRQPVLTFIRIMGYYRPIQSANLGKRSEAYSRTYYKEGYTCPRIFDMARANAEFNTKYSD